MDLKGTHCKCEEGGSLDINRRNSLYKPLEKKTLSDRHKGKNDNTYLVTLVVSRKKPYRRHPNLIQKWMYTIIYQRYITR